MLKPLQNEIASTGLLSLPFLYTFCQAILLIFGGISNNCLLLPCIGFPGGN